MMKSFDIESAQDFFLIKFYQWNLSYGSFLQSSASAFIHTYIQLHAVNFLLGWLTKFIKMLNGYNDWPNCGLMQVSEQIVKLDGSPTTK